MRELSAVASTIHLVVALTAMWVLVFLFWKPYRIDAFRQRLFALRDDLFSYAETGQIRFDHPSYIYLEKSINRAIRLAEQLTFIRMLPLIFLKDQSIDDRVVRLNREWSESLDLLPTTSDRHQM